MKGITPLYQKVKDHILSKINSGEWTESQRVPSENELVRDFNISRMTANRALRELTAEGYLIRVAGVGTFVSIKKAHSHLLEIHNIAAEVESRGHEYSADVIYIKDIKADEDIAEKMELKLNASVFHSLIVHKEQGVPIQIEDRFVNKQLVPDYDKVDFTKTTPAKYLISTVPLQEVEHIVQAVMPDKRTAKLLELANNEPCLVIRRRTWSKGKIASYGWLFHAGSRYELSGRFNPDPRIPF